MARKIIGLGATVAVSLLVAAPANAATITVGTTSELVAPGNGDCTLREAVNSANNNNLDANADCTDGQAGSTDTIVLGGGVYTINGAAGEEMNATGDLDVCLTCGDVVIDGLAPALTFIDANRADADANDDRVLHVRNAGQATVQDLTVRNGLGPAGSPGGGIYAADGANLVLSNAVVVSNMAVAVGGIATASDAGSLTITGSSVSANETTTSIGGGLLHEGTGNFMLANSRLQNNEAAGGAAGARVSPSAAATATVSGSRITDNGAASLAGGMSFFMSNPTDAITIESSLIHDNDATLLGGGLSIGVGTADIEDTVISDNTVTTIGVAGFPDAEGGGLRIGSGVTVRLTRSAVTGNDATALVTEDKPNGGGIYSEGVLTIRDSTIADNHAVPTDDPANGGGIWDGGVQPLNISNSTIANNTAATFGGGILDLGGGGTLARVTLLDNDLTDLLSSGDQVNYFGGVPDPTIRGSLIEGDNPDGDCSGAFTSGGHNVTAGNSCGLMQPTDLQDTPSGALPLADNGGRLAGPPGLQSVIQTAALPTGSLAVDRGPASCVDADLMALTADQRGLPRPVNGACDAGAYELQPPSPAPITPTPAAAAPAATAPPAMAVRTCKKAKKRKGKKKRKCKRRKKRRR